MERHAVETILGAELDANHVECSREVSLHAKCHLTMRTRLQYCLERTQNGCTNEKFREQGLEIG